MRTFLNGLLQSSCMPFMREDNFLTSLPTIAPLKLHFTSLHELRWHRLKNTLIAPRSVCHTPTLQVLQGPRGYGVSCRLTAQLRRKNGSLLLGRVDAIRSEKNIRVSPRTVASPLYYHRTLRPCCDCHRSLRRRQNKLHFRFTRPYTAC